MKLSKETGLIILLIGFFWTFYYSSKTDMPISDKRTNILDKISINGLLIPYFEYIGIFLLLLIFSVEFLYSDSNFGQSSTLVLLFSLILLSYNSVPSDFWKERDFMFLFFFFLILFVAFPPIFENALSSTPFFGNHNIDNSIFIYYFLGKPLITLLHLFGYNFVSSGDVIYYQDLNAGHTVSVWIARSCSGYYSIVIFVAAYISYILSNQNNFNIEIAAMMLIGILIAYLANLFRMAIVILAGHYWGGDALIWTHTNVGWLIFTFWILIFWPFLSKVIDKQNSIR